MELVELGTVVGVMIIRVSVLDVGLVIMDGFLMVWVLIEVDGMVINVVMLFNHDITVVVMLLVLRLFSLMSQEVL